MPDRTSHAIESWMLDLLACPICEGHPKLALLSDGVTLQCANNRHQFPISDGIPLLREQDATEVNSAEPTPP